MAKYEFPNKKIPATRQNEFFICTNTIRNHVCVRWRCYTYPMHARGPPVAEEKRK